MGFFDGFFKEKSNPILKTTIPTTFPQYPPTDPLEDLKKMKETVNKIKTIVLTDSKLEGGKIGIERAAREYEKILANLEKQQKEADHKPAVYKQAHFSWTAMLRQ